MKLSTTHWLSIAIVVLAITSLWSFGRMQAAADAASISARDRAVVEMDTADIHAAGGTPSTRPANELDLSGRIRNAAAAAGVSDQLLSIEPAEGSSAQGVSSSGEGDARTAMSVFIRFGTLTIRQLGEFAGAVSDRGAGIDVNTIDLTDPALQQQQSQTSSPLSGIESWSTQLTLVVRSTGALQ